MQTVQASVTRSQKRKKFMSQKYPCLKESISQKLSRLKGREISLDEADELQSFTYSSTIEPAPMVIRAVPRFWIACNGKSVNHKKRTCQAEAQASRFWVRFSGIIMILEIPA